MAAIKVMEETKEAPAGGESAEGGEGEGDGETAAETKKTGDSMESRERQELVTLRTEKVIRDVCESLQFMPSKLQLKSMIGLSDAERREYIKEQKGLVKPAGTRAGSTPRTATGRTGTDVQESRAAGVRKDVDFTDNSEEARRKRYAYLKN